MEGYLCFNTNNILLTGWDIIVWDFIYYIIFAICYCKCLVTF